MPHKDPAIRNAYHRALYHADTEKQRARGKRYRDANREKSAARARKYRAENGEKVRAACRKAAQLKGRGWHEANPDKLSAYAKRYREGSRETIRQKARIALYGVTPERFAALLAEQGSACAICRRPSTDQKMCIDHDHATGAVRGILCRGCNWALGQMGDDPARLESAAGYLRRAKRESDERAMDGPGTAYTIDTNPVEIAA